MLFEIDDVARLVLSLPDVLQCWVQDADEDDAIDVFVRLEPKCSMERRQALRDYLRHYIEDHHVWSPVRPRITVVNRLSPAGAQPSPQPPEQTPR